MGIYTLKKIRYLSDSLTFWAPFNDPDNPLLVRRGGPLTMVRATEALRFDGTKYVDAANDILRIEKGVDAVVLGALIEGQRTFQELLRTDTSQDQLASWTSTGITATSDADADAYGGNRWTLTADGSDRVFVQTITIAAATRSLAFYVRRTDGGVVDGTFCLIYREGSDRTTTYTHIGGNVYKVQEADFTGSAGAADTGLKVKSGKTVQLVAPMGLEDGEFSSSAIPTTDAAVTRNMDDLTFASSGSLDGTVGTMMVSVDMNEGVGESRTILNSDLNYANQIILHRGSNKISSQDGTTVVDGSTWATNDVVSVGARWSGSGRALVIDGALTTGLAFDGAFATASNVVEIGHLSGSSTPLFGHIKNLEIYDVAFSDTQMIGKTS